MYEKIMELIKIINSDNLITPNFKFSEYFNPKLASAKIEFDIPKCLVDAQEILRSWFNVGILITSTIRPKDTFGFHRTGNAIDSIPIERASEILSEFKTQCYEYKKSILIKELRSVGVKGMGVEASCFHLDYRPDINCGLSDNNGKFHIFEWSQEPKPKGTNKNIM